MAVRITHSGTHKGVFRGIPPTGRRFEQAQMHFLRFEGGKAAEHWAVRDDLGMLQQLGALPTPGQEDETSQPEKVLSYWFPPGIHDADIETYRAQVLRWFEGGPEVDREIAGRFATVLEQARQGELDHWARTPRGRLALIIVLDQFSRSVYKGAPPP